ncbi:hypothetical protein ACHAXR_002922, partial [Thalassiosira sp. AJA248-18]
MVALATGFHILCDSLAGYLLVIALTSGYPLVTKLIKLPPQVKKSLKVHPNLPDLQEFNPAECLLLYLVAYPAFVMYRSGGILGFLTLALGLMGVLGGVIGPAMIKFDKEEEDKSKKNNGGIIKDNSNKGKDTDIKQVTSRGSIFKKEISVTSKTSSTLTVDSSVAPALQDESSGTPTMANKGTQSEAGPRKENVKFEEKAVPTEAATPATTTVSSSQQVNNLLCQGCKQKLENKGVRTNNIFSGMKRHNSERHNSDVLPEDEEDLSVVTWDPAFAKETKGGPAGGPGGDSQGNKAPTRPSIVHAHRRIQSTHSYSIPDSSLIKEMDGNLIDSNLEPHYSNLIDSANAPIFGVDSAGRVNVWNKCAMRIVGYTPDEVMGKSLVKEFITKDYQESVGAVIDRALRGDETANYEFPLMTKDGVRIEILLNATARRNPEGNIIGV